MATPSPLKLSDLVGPHTLTGVDLINDPDKHADQIRFTLGKRTYLATEDPDDGYRSYMGSLTVSKGEGCANRFKGVAVVGQMREGSCDILELVHAASQLLVLEVGTDNTDDYYPCWTARFWPERLVAPEPPVIDPFVTAFNTLAAEVNTTARAKGWWDKERNDGEIIALIHSELSEALEALRHGNPPDDKLPAFSGVEAEFADVIIRIMDLAPARGWRIAEAVVAKMAFNRTRERMHGGKRF